MARLRRIAVFLLFQTGRTAERVATLTDYLAIGTRQIADMNIDSRQMWQAFYDSHPSPDSRLLPWEEAFVERFVKPGADVLLVGCGSGRDLLPLVERGCHVTGIDPVNSALGRARRMLVDRGMSATLIEGFFEDTPVCGMFDAVIFSYHCYSAIPVSGRRIAALEKAATLLKPDGHIVISHAKTTKRPRGILVKLARITSALCRTDWRLEPGDLVWDNRQRRPSYSYTHAFEAGELEREAERAHLHVVFHRASDDDTVVAGLARS